MKACLAVAAVLSVAIFSSSGPAQALNIGTLAVGTPYADVIQSAGPNFSRDYNFHLDASTEVTILASAQAQTSANFGVNALTISLFDSSSTQLATDSGVPLASFDSFDQSGISLLGGDYLLRVFGTVPAGFKAFINVALVPNDFIAATPIPGALLLLFTALGGLGGAGILRKHRATGQSASLAA
jgi:hypothetical protein